ncbi:hypothetical protein H5410_001552 [Solanum commersonii]|uniref:Uncharacterized protein n=1 Tax=Solanum commersonii TaxID=4109 RepID=A0A9J6B000_SOLCO|nr:hypothetical protein H5410_001552 [Solanum commersonii]
MVRTRTSASGYHEPIPASAYVSTIRGRGRGRGRGQGRGRGRDRTVPPDADVIHGDVQDRVEGNGPAQAPPNIIATLVLQDTFTHMLGLLEGMAQVGTLPVTSDASQTRVEGQTPRNQPAAAVAPYLDSTEFPGIVSHLANRPSMTIDE